MSVYPSVTKSVFRSVHKSLKVPPAVAGSSGGGGAFDPDLSSIQSRILDGGTIWTDQISSKYYLKDQSTDNTHLPRQGRAWLFDGINDAAATSGNVGLTGDVTATLCAWVKPVALADFKAVVSFGSFVIASQAFCLGFMANGAVGLFTAGGRSAITAASQLTTGAWYHICVVKTPGTLEAANTKIYVNGVSIALSTTSATTPSVVAAPIRVGSDLSLGSTSGCICDVRIYSSAKDSTAVAAIYNQSLTGNGTFDETNLVACYPCNEEAGTTGYDIGPNAYHLTLTNITEATFHATDTGVLTNRNNDDGYREDITVTKTASSSWTNSQFWSNQPISATQAATISVKTRSQNVVIGFSSNPPERLTGSFKMYMNNGWLKPIVSGVAGAQITTYTTTDVVSISKEASGVVTISKNGVTLYTFAATISGVTYVDGSAYEVGAYATINIEGRQLTDITGFTSVSQMVPKRLSSSLAADGNALTVTGRAAYHGCAETPCFTGNGSNTSITISSVLASITGDFEFTGWYNPGQVYGALWGDSTNGLYHNNLTGTFRLYVANTHTQFTGVTLVIGQWHFWKVTRISGTVSMWIDGVALTRNAGPDPNNGTITITSIATGFSGFPILGSISDFRFTIDGVTTYFPLQDGPGSSNTNRDIAWVKSDGTGGVISNAIVNGTVSTIWGNRVPGQVKDWCVENGGRIGAAGEYIAGLIGSANAADGNAKTLSAGKYGNPYSRLNSNPATAAEFNGRSVPTAGEVGDLINGTITPDDTGFNRVDTDGDDRFLIYEDTLTGADLTNVENYVS